MRSTRESMQRKKKREQVDWKNIGHFKVGERKKEQQRTVARETKRKSGSGGVTEAHFKEERSLLLMLK